MMRRIVYHNKTYKFSDDKYYEMRDKINEILTMFFEYQESNYHLSSCENFIKEVEKCFCKFIGNEISVFIFEDYVSIEFNIRVYGSGKRNDWFETKIDIEYTNKYFNHYDIYNLFYNEYVRKHFEIYCVEDDISPSELNMNKIKNNSFFNNNSLVNSKGDFAPRLREILKSYVDFSNKKYIKYLEMIKDLD